MSTSTEGGHARGEDAWWGSWLRRLAGAWQGEANHLVVEEVAVPLPGLAADLQGMRIVQLGDIHLRSRGSEQRARHAVELGKALQPDLVVLTGDNVLLRAEGIHRLAPILAGLRPRYGTFAVPGNHERWTNLAVVRQGLEGAGVTVLVNAGRALRIGTAQLYVAGVDDAYYGRPDLAAALAGWQAPMPVILLAHEPDLADRFLVDGRVALQLSGHSHGGQVRLPGIGALILPRYGKKYDQGLFRIGSGWLYTTRGVGMCPPSVRINCPPEVTHITLVAERD